jgi:hypothetical protein
MPLRSLSTFKGIINSGQLQNDFDNSSDTNHNTCE